MARLRNIKIRAAIPTMGMMVATFLLLVSFQNCSQFTVSDSLKTLSASCVAKIQEKAPELLVMLAPVDCMALENYSCEVRRFSPEVTDGQTESSECMGGASCLRLTVRTYDTKPAMKTAEQKDYEAGGTYNHSEAQCVHSARFRNASLFIGQGDDLKSALNSAKSACLSAQAQNGASR